VNLAEEYINKLFTVRTGSHFLLNHLFFSSVRVTSLKFLNQLFTLKNDCLPLHFKLRKFVSFPKNLISIEVLQDFQEVLRSFYESVL